MKKTATGLAALAFAGLMSSTALAAMSGFGLAARAEPRIPGQHGTDEQLRPVIVPSTNVV